MVNFRLVSRIIGQLLFIETAFMTLCLLMAFYYGEDDVVAFAVSIAVTLLGAFLFKWAGRESGINMSRRDAYLVVTLTWAVFSFFGMLPFLIGGYIRDVADAYFETMSGFTTTGCTILSSVERLPHALLFWRSLTQWIGALGIVFFTIAVMPSMVGGSVKVFAAEATGPIRTRMHPRLTTSAKWIWSIYLALTAACMGAYWIFGMDIFDSLNHAMTTTATGGFSTHDDSAEYFHSAAIDYSCVIFQFLAGINFTVLYVAIFKGRVMQLLRSSEFRLYISLIAGTTVWIMWLLIHENGYAIEPAFRSAVFQTVSFITTTGLFNDDAGAWPHITWVILGCLMFVGGCAGSTSGGFKCVRGVMLLEVLRNEFRRIIHPNAVLPVRVNGVSVPQQKINALLSFFAVYIIMCLIAATIMIAVGIDNTNAITIALSCMSNVGPTLGTEIGPVMSWGSLPDTVKWICSLLMLMGRIEIMSVLVLFTKEYWAGH